MLIIDFFFFFFHGDESIRTTKYIGQISSGLMHVATVNVSSSVQAKQRLLLPCVMLKYIYILHPQIGCFPLMSEIPKAFPSPSISKSSVISG